MRPPANPEAWKRMVLKSMPSPAWLRETAPDRDVVLSSRVRVMRNLRQLRFPHAASDAELALAMRQILQAADAEWEVFRSLTNAERDFFVGSRLVSPEFPWTQPSRALLVDPARSQSIMINEEDHLRIQCITAGLSVSQAEGNGLATEQRFAARLDFAHHPEFGFVSASPFNAGTGMRRSAMIHLIGLAQTGRLGAIMHALGQRNIAVRGLFGESSRAIGAFAQVSQIGGPMEEFAGACEYLLAEERIARDQFPEALLRERLDQTMEFIRRTPRLGLADALRVAGWIRWASVAGVKGFGATTVLVDRSLSALELGSGGDEAEASSQRANLLREIAGA